MPPFSVVIITYNEAENIGACLKAAKKVSDDIVVIDAKSEDETVEICREMGVRVFEKEWKNYSVNKNFGNDLAKNDWIISIDADEVLSEELVNSIQELESKEGQVYTLDRISNYCGKWIRYGGWYPDWKIRIFNRKEVRWKGDYVHEILDIPSGFEVIRLKGKLWHYSFKSRKDFKNRQRKYAKLAAEDLHKRQKRVTLFQLWGSPLIRFLRDYIWKLGCFDGYAGYEIARENASVVFRKYQLLKQWNRASD